MDRLLSGQQLARNEDRRSGNGRYRIIQQDDGNLVLYESAAPGKEVAIWSTRQNGTPIDRTLMDGSGNLVSLGNAAWWPFGPWPYWQTATWFNPNAHAVIQDDGNFVVYTADDRPVWASDDFHLGDAPTIPSGDSRGYAYVEVARWWRQLCAGLPCWLGLAWDGYDTTAIEDSIDGEPVVIQLWKGRCQKAFNETFPGGVGLEVGVYRRQRERSLAFLAPGAAAIAIALLPILGPGAVKFAEGLVGASVDDLWWPVTDRPLRIGASFANPTTGETVFESPELETWWRTKWMDDRSFEAYRQSEGGGAPGYTGYRVDFEINGKTYPSW